MLDLLAADHVSAASVSPSLQTRPRFRPISGKLESVNFLRTSPPLKGAFFTEAQKAGLRYETKVRLMLQHKRPDIRLGAWFGLKDSLGTRIVQLDALYLDGCYAIIFEIKRHHCLEAWQQLRLLYQPIVSAWRPDFQVRVIEVCKSFDPMVPLPEPIFRISDINEVRERDSFFVWKCDI